MYLIMTKNDPLIRILIDAVRCNIKDGVNNIFVVGSRAYDEYTVIDNVNNNREYIVSDLDVFIDLNIRTYLLTFFTPIMFNVNKTIKDRLIKEKIVSNISISFRPLKLGRYLPFFYPNNLYLFEFRPIYVINDKFIIGNKGFDIIPKDIDALNLLFSSLADYIYLVSSKKDNVRIREYIYTLSKRCLTVLYCVLIFNKVYSSSYIDRIILAKKKSLLIDYLISTEELKIFELLTKYKISGDYKLLNNLVETSSINYVEIYYIVDKFFKKTALKTLVYGLCLDNNINNKINNYLYADVDKLLIDYKNSRRINFFNSLIFSFLSMFSFLRHKNIYKLKFELYSLMNNRLKPNHLLRYYMGKHFIKYVYYNKINPKEVMNLIKNWRLIME